VVEVECRIRDRAMPNVDLWPVPGSAGVGAIPVSASDPKRTRQ